MLDQNTIIRDAAANTVSLTTGTCTPVKDRANYCSEFYTTFYVFGNDVEDTTNYAKSLIAFALADSLPRVLSFGVRRVDAVSIETVEAISEKGVLDTVPLAAICGLIVSAGCIVLGLVLLFLYVKKDRIRHQKLHLTQRKLLGSMSGSVRYYAADGHRVEDAETDSFSSEISSVQMDFEKGAVSKMPDDNVRVEFDASYASSVGPSEASSRAPSETMEHPPHYLDESGRLID